MKTIYKGFEIDVRREKCLGGWSQLYWSVSRISDGWEMISDFADTEDTPATLTQCMKNRIDEYLANPELYEVDGWFDATT